MWLKVGGPSLWAAHKGQKVGGPRPARPNSFRRQWLGMIGGESGKHEYVENGDGNAKGESNQFQTADHYKEENNRILSQHTNIRMLC